jgi:hypothetical protein
MITNNTLVHNCNYGYCCTIQPHGKHSRPRRAKSSPRASREQFPVKSVAEDLAVVSAPALLGDASRDERERARVSTMPLIVVCGVAGVAETFAAKHMTDMTIAAVAQDLHAGSIGVAFFIDCIRDDAPEPWPATAAVELHL